MSIASEIERLQTAKSDLKTSINTKTDAQHQITTETLDDYADFVDSISTGSSKPEQSKTTNPSTSQVVVTPDTGYTLSSVTVNAMPIGALNTPTINSSTGLVTATIGTSGYLASGTNKTLQLSTQSAQTITPTTTDQTISSGKYLTGTQTISGDTNLVAGNIKKDVTIFGVTGTHEGGGSATLITKSITQNGTYNASSDNADGYSQVTVNVSSGQVEPEPEEKDVNFYDYDGTRLYSYTKAEFLALESMPENPTHAGLTPIGWNWDLSDAQAFVTDYKELEIGQNYLTDDLKTRVYIKIPDSSLTIQLNVKFSNNNNSKIVNWGDGQESTYSNTTSISGTHTYEKSGEYKIEINHGNSNIRFSGNATSGADLISKSGYSGDMSNRVFCSFVKKIELGPTDFYNSNRYCFSQLCNLETITMPKSTTTANQFFPSFENCTKLKCIIIPKGIASLSTDYTFQQCRNLKIISLPINIGSATYTFQSCYDLKKLQYAGQRIDQFCFAYCYDLEHLIIPKSVTYINQYAFYGSSIGKYYFSKHTSIPILVNTNAFGNVNPDYKIYVPSSLYNSWITASNWSSIASHIKKIEEE